MEIRYEYTPALSNDPALVERGVAAMADAIGDENFVAWQHALD